MLKEFSIIFCTMLYMLKEIHMGPLPQPGPPISQWSGEINGYENNKTWAIPGFGMGGEPSNGGQGNGMNGGQGNGMSSGQGNGMSWGQGNGMNSVPGMFGWQGNGMNGGSGNGMNGGSGNGMNGGSGNGMNGGPNNYGMNSNYSFGEIQSQASGVPGSGYPASYYQQYSNQTIIVPTPANVQDFQNTTAPNQNMYADQINSNGGNMGNMGNINNPTAFQFQGCMPQSSFPTISPANETVTQGSTSETTESSNGSEDNKSSTTASTRKRNKH